MKRFLVLFAAALIGAGSPAATTIAWAQGRGQYDDRDDDRGRRGNPSDDGWSRGGDARGGRLVPLEQVIRGIARSSPGRLLDAGLEGGDRPIYRVRWQTNDGRRIDYIVDARTGQIIGRD
ncbi:PepSY domain-containing protein [Caulobacter mirabilis]|uniref:PepSY domain-containing protein n=1 Tax=Caulobacter mirabilis TaxID=69666 RepID=A0A2D2AVX8_9CAUL|nr:PepSY domain-containing protein [Caulobacter mirabilis]ATQ42146.1 hypothetical protein CSW64_06820 [Caulobacter mirabilis]